MGIRLRDHYDWVVLGDHPGALLSAGLAARLGLSVLVLPLVPAAKTVISESGQCLDPESNYLIGLGSIERFQGLLSDCLGRLGISPAESTMIQREGVLPQVLTPGKRLSLLIEDDLLDHELTREFGQEWVQACALPAALSHGESPSLAFWKRLPDRLTFAQSRNRKGVEPHTLEGLRQKLERTWRGSSYSGYSGYSGKRASRSIRRTDQEWFSNTRRLLEFCLSRGGEDFAEVCQGLWYGVSSSAAEDPLVSELVHMLVLGRTGAGFSGGMTAYRDFLVRLAKRLGAHVPPKGECSRIFIEDGKLVGVQITHQGTMIGASGAILGCSIGQAREYMSITGKSWFSRLKPVPVPAAWRFTLAMTVHAEAIPPGMSRRTIWKETGAPVLEIEVAHPGDYVLDEPEHRLLFARTLLPYTREGVRPDFQRLISARMLRQLTELIPFLEYHLVRLYPDFRNENTEMSQAFGFASPEMIPENLRVYSGPGVGSRSGIDGLFVASNESFPALGSFGGTVAALESIAWLAHRTGLSGPFA